MKYSCLSYFGVLTSLITLSSCSALKTSADYELGDGYYNFHVKHQPASRVYLKVTEDSIAIFPSLVNSIPSNKQLFTRPTFDVDVLTMPFKYRPSTLSFPRQMDTDFNGNLYLGYRIDRFLVERHQTPAGPKKHLKHRAISGGVFGGVGSSFISTWTTNYRSTDEYSGFILSRGFALLAGVNNLTVGLGIGWDTLTDRDKNIWIYQNKPWYGVAVGLNIN